MKMGDGGIQRFGNKNAFAGVMDVYQEMVMQHSLGRKFGECYCRDSVIHESGTKSALIVNMQVKVLVRFMAHTK